MTETTTATDELNDFRLMVDRCCGLKEPGDYTEVCESFGCGQIVTLLNKIQQQRERAEKLRTSLKALIRLGKETQEGGFKRTLGWAFGLDQELDLAQAAIKELEATDA